MEDLKQMEMVGRGLILIDRAETIRRYNSGLKRLGLEPTKLTQFHIDGIGWSPEIAEEKRDRWYLSQGIANPRGIIVTINQENKPIYTPTHSFTRLMMKHFFEMNRIKIADLTTQTGIALEIDQNMTWYRTVEQVESVRSVKIVSDAGALAKKAESQQRLVAAFMDPEADDWMNPFLREKLLTDFRVNGKLYDRQLVIEPFSFKEFDDYHTLALGGIYVFRNFGEKSVTIVEDKALFAKVDREKAPHVVLLKDPNIIDVLFREEMVGIDVEWYRANPQVLFDRLRTLGFFILSNHNRKLRIDEMNSAQIVANLTGKCPAEATRIYEELELCVSHIQNKESIEHFSNEVKALLLHPVRSSSRYEENLIWRLICQIQTWPVDIMRLYSVDKNLFIDNYANWSGPMKTIARRSLERYDSEKTYQERTE
jgi:hypothetical protein